MNVHKETVTSKYDYCIPNFVHRPGFHCRSTAMRDIFEFHGFNMSEALIFGLGSGIGLGYLKMWGTEPFLGGSTKDFISTLCKSTGVTLNEFTSKNADEGWKRLKDRLEQNVPSAIYIDMAFLNYQELPQDYHFGYHSIVVCGYNPEKKTVLVADTQFPDLKEITVRELTEGRNSKHDRFMPPQNTIFEVIFPAKLRNLESVIKETLQTTVQGIISKSNRMMKMMGVNAGLQGLDSFKKDLESWLKLPEDKLQLRCENQAGYISSYGTGGGACRYLYADFLTEASELLNDQSLQTMSQFYKHIGDKWEELAQLFQKIPLTTEIKNRKQLLTDSMTLIDTIKELETQGATDLQNYGK